MMRRVLIVAAVLGLVAHVAGATVITVNDPADLTGARSSRTLTSGLTGSVVGLPGTLTMDWSIAYTGSVYNYAYSFSGTENATVGTWDLAVSPAISAGITFTNGTAGSIVPNVVTSKGTFANAIVFTAAGSSGYTFTTTVTPVWGSAFISGTSDNGAYTVWNTAMPTQQYPTGASPWPYTNWVPTVDSGFATTVVPEPSLSILALLGLIGGAFGRRACRKKKAA